jgi:hypothetical protein
MTDEKALKQLRTRAHWRARRQRVEKEIADKKQLQAQVGRQAKKELETYIVLLKNTLYWLKKTESSTD